MSFSAFRAKSPLIFWISFQLMERDLVRLEPAKRDASRCTLTLLGARGRGSQLVRIIQQSGRL